MPLKRILCALLLFCALPCLVLCEGSVVNLIENPKAEYSFADDVELLEIVFPRVHSSDCAVIRFGDEVMMLDASTQSESMHKRIKSALEAMNVTHIDTAFNSHPHGDHISGFEVVYGYAPFDKLILTYPEDFNKYMISAVNFMHEHEIPIEHAADGDILTMGNAGEVTMQVIQKDGPQWSENDQSAMLKVVYGDRSILFTADIENRAQAYYAENPPECGLDVDILKYPHHGIARMNNNLLESISPEISLINGGSKSGQNGRDYMKKKRLPYLVGYKGLTRMRTDGVIWVVDYLDEIVTDR